MHCVDASLGPVGFCMRPVHPSCAVLVHLERQHIGCDGRLIDIPKAQESGFFLYIYTHIFVDDWIVIQSTDIDTPNGLDVFLKGGSPRITKGFASPPESLNTVIHNPFSHNTSDVPSTKEWPPYTSSPLARREITFTCHNSVLPPYRGV